MAEAYRIGPFLLDAVTGAVTREGVPVAMGKRAADVLAELVRQAPAYVPKSRLLEAAWPGLVVQESNLAVQVLAIRRALSQAPGGDAWLETLARRGYRFVGPVARVDVAQARSSQAGARASNLAEPPTSFVGRERELADVEALLRRSRLLTLTGTGGVGKTRLALRAAAAARARYGDGVWLVELAALSDPGLVSHALAVTLGVREEPGRSLLDTLAGHLGSRHCLLLIDNAEHLVAACAELVVALERRCPEVSFLVTSRERLAVPGEVTYRVPSLGLPDPVGAASAASLMGCDSVTLLAERARLHHPEFELTERNAPVIASICRRLDGIALAIELAAARVRSMSAEELHQRLDQRLALLTGGSRTLPRRQQTLRAAIEWSYDLLDPVEQALFCRLAVFSGGFVVEAAEGVCAGEPIEAGAVLDLAAALVDKSLVLAEERGGVTRHRLLETIQQFAAERLEASGDAGRWRRAHFDCFLELAERAEPQLTGRDQRQWLDRLDVEHDNLRAALSHAVAGALDAGAGLRLATALSRFWLVRGHVGEGRRWLSQLLARAGDEDGDRRAKALNWAGVLAWKQGDYAAARELYGQALALRRAQGDQRGIGMVLSNLGLLAYEQGDYAAAQPLHEESLAIDRALGDAWGVAVSLVHLGSLDAAHGEVAKARARFEESLAIFRERGDRGHVASLLHSLGLLASQQADPSAAAFLDESLAICRELGDRAGIAWALDGLATLALRVGDHATASNRAQEALAIFRDLGHRKGIATALHHLGEIAAAGGDHVEARGLQEASLAVYRELEERSGVAAVAESLAGVASASGEPLHAARLWGAVERLRDEVRAPRPASERQEYERLVAAARALASAPAFERAWQEGRGMTLDQALAGWP